MGPHLGVPGEPARQVRNPVGLVANDLAGIGFDAQLEGASSASQELPDAGLRVEGGLTRLRSIQEGSFAPGLAVLSSIAAGD